MGLMRLSDLRYEPDQSKLWDAKPGSVYQMTNMVPTPRGTYSTFGSDVWFSTGALAGVESPLIGFMAPLLDGTSRFLVCTAAKIDEYDTSLARTNRGSGYAAGSNTWSLAQYGNSTIATNYVDAVQVATGAGSAFAALGGSPPKAKIVVAQSNFVLLFNITDGATTYEDGWQCSGLGNSTSWTTVGGAANLSTQANNGRLLQAPGPITAAVAFRDVVVAFKDNAIFVGQYSGNPFGFAWRMVTNQVGTHSIHGVVEHRGKLYFWHTSGFYTFDGQQLQNIGDGAVNTSFYYDRGYGFAASALTDVMAVADDVLCNVYFLSKNTGQSYRADGYVFNTVCGKWGDVSFLKNSERASNNLAVFVKATTYQVVNFKSTAVGRVLWLKWINGSTTLTAQTGRENFVTPSGDGASLTIAFGDRGSSKRIGSAYFDYGTQVGSATVVDAGSGMSLTVTGGQSPAQLANIDSSSAFAYNSNTLAHNGEAVGKFFDVQATTTTACAIDAITLDISGVGKQ